MEKVRDMSIGGEEQNEDFQILQFWIHSWLDSSG